jgi:hypothetical protein
MTAAELKIWIKRRHLKHSEAADLLALSRDGLRKNLYGVTSIGPQTERIIELLNEAEITPPAPRYDRLNLPIGQGPSASTPHKAIR